MSLVITSISRIKKSSKGSSKKDEFGVSANIAFGDTSAMIF